MCVSFSLLAVPRSPLTAGAPYCLIGELILIEGSIDRTSGVPLIRRQRGSLDASDIDEDDFGSDRNAGTAVTSLSQPPRSTSLHSRNASGSSLDALPPKPRLTLQLATPEPSPLIASAERMSDENEVSLVLHHGENEEDEGQLSPIRPISPGSNTSSPVASMLNTPGETSTADKAGVILGIHNVFIVLPQFVVTIMASLIFYLMEPSTEMPSHHPSTIPIVGNVTEAVISGDPLARMGSTSLLPREGMVEAKSSDAVGLIFRIGGVSAAISGFICMRLARSWARGEGI